MVASPSAPAPAAAVASASLDCPSPGQSPLRFLSLGTAAGIQPAWQGWAYSKASQKSVSSHLKLSLLNSIITLGLYTTTNLFHFYNAEMGGRRNFYSRKPNN